MKLLKNLLMLVIVIGGIAAVIIFHEPISEFSDGILQGQEGEKALARGDWNGAMAIFEDNWQKNSGNMKTALKLAKIYHRQSQYYANEGFVEYAGRDSRRKRKNVQLLEAEAEKLFKTVVEKDPGNLEGRMAYARFLQDHGRFGAAADQLQEAFKNHKTEPKLLTALGNLYKAAAENPLETRSAIQGWLYDWAIYYYRLALKTDPALFQPRFNLGVIYHLHTSGTKPPQERIIKAVREYCNALMISPKSYETHYNLGLALVDMNAIEAGFRQLSNSVNILADQSRVLEAQHLAQQIQTVRNSIFYEDRQYQVTADDMEPWLRECLGLKAPSKS